MLRCRSEEVTGVWARTENAYRVLVGKPKVMKPVGRDVKMGR
jgi:hypothetical protein